MQMKPAQLSAYASLQTHHVSGSNKRAGAGGTVQGGAARANQTEVGGSGPQPLAARAKGADAPTLVDLSPEAVSALAQKTLETEVGEQLSAAFAEAGVDLSEGVGQDWSVEATAQRIVDFSTGLYGVFREQHADLSEEEAKELFEQTLRDAVDTGYGQAVQVLQGMSMSDDILGQAEATITRVHELFDDYFKEEDAEGVQASAAPQPE